MMVLRVRFMLGSDGNLEHAPATGMRIPKTPRAIA